MGRGKALSPPKSQLFEIHGSEFKPHPFGDLGQTTVLGITHGVFFLGVGKDPFNRFLSFCVKITILRGVSGVVGKFLAVFPDVPGHGNRPDWWCCIPRVDTPGR